MDNMQHSTTSDAVSLPRRVLAGGVVAVLAASTALLVGGISRSAANGVTLSSGTLTDHFLGIVATVPFVAMTVLILGIPVAMLVEWLCERASRFTTVLIFSGAGIAAGAVTSMVFTSGITLLFIWPAVAAAVLGRGLADPLARRPVRLTVVTSAAATLLAASLLATV